MAHNLKFVLLAVGTMVMVVLGVSAYLYSSPSLPPTEVAYYPDGEPPSFRAPSVDGKRLYKNPILAFSLYYPDDLFIREYGEANTSTITLEDTSGEKGFQIFVVPYEGDTVSAERFKMDLPSGIMREAQEVTIDGVRGSAFFSQDTLIGETREVWFIYGGFLYEVTARKELDAWLSSIMKTWEFIR